MDEFNGVLVLDTSQYLSVLHTGSDKFATGLTVGRIYRYCCDGDSWISVAVTGGAAARDTANNHFVNAGEAVIFTTYTASMFLHAIADSIVAASDATLSLVG